MTDIRNDFSRELDLQISEFWKEDFSVVIYRPEIIFKMEKTNDSLNLIMTSEKSQTRQAT